MDCSLRLETWELHGKGVIKFNVPYHQDVERNNMTRIGTKSKSTTILKERRSWRITLVHLLQLISSTLAKQIQRTKNMTTFNRYFHILIVVVEVITPPSCRKKSVFLVKESTSVITWISSPTHQSSFYP